ncbi:hypothetical protein HBB16_12410 [Pseudonocardia sp. MCCB 268]|nr:hypothetical protein [Pseudonocardia cytotoxica]
MLTAITRPPPVGRPRVYISDVAPEKFAALEAYRPSIPSTPPGGDLAHVVGRPPKGWGADVVFEPAVTRGSSARCGKPPRRAGRSCWWASRWIRCHGRRRRADASCAIETVFRYANAYPQSSWPLRRPWIWAR